MVAFIKRAIKTRLRMQNLAHYYCRKNCSPRPKDRNILEIMRHPPSMTSE